MAAKPIDFELTGSGEPTPVSARYGGVRVLARVLGVPVASAERPNVPQQLTRPSLRQSFAGSFGPEFWAELVSRGWVTGTDEVEPLPISAVVCTRNRAESLETCLRALALQRHRTFEVVVVDNAPSDDSAQLVAERHGARYVVEPTPGLNWARNRGIATARFPLVAFTDDDARPDPHWLAALAAGFSAAEIAAVTGFVAPAELETRAQVLFEDVYGGMGKGYALRIFAHRTGRVSYRPEVYGVGCNMAFRRALLADMGGFDPALDTGTATGGGGDLDIFQRLVERGEVIAYRPDAVVRHTHRRMMRGLRRQIFDNGRGYCAVLCTAFLRASGRERLRVAGAAWSWLTRWHLRRIIRRLLRREALPLRLMLAELLGAIVGPYLYVLARRRARQLAKGRQ